MKRLIILSFAIVLGTVGCGSSQDIAAGNLTGKMRGEPWTFGSALTESAFSDGDSHSATLYDDKTQVECGRFDNGGTSPIVLISLPKTPGTYELNFSLFDLENSRSVTLAPAPGDNIILTEGLIEVESIDGKVIRAGMFASDGTTGNELSGHFSVTMCETTP